MFVDRSPRRSHSVIVGECGSTNDALHRFYGYLSRVAVPVILVEAKPEKSG